MWTTNAMLRDILDINRVVLLIGSYTVIWVEYLSSGDFLTLYFFQLYTIMFVRII